MRNVNVLALSGSDHAATGVALNGNLIDANQLISASFHCYFGDSTATGTFKLQMSNDPTPLGNLALAQFTPTHWVDIPNQSAAITAGASALLTLGQMAYRWVRAVFVSSATHASLVVQDLTYTAVAYGVAGNSVTITYLNPGAPSQSLSVSVSGNDITVHLATNGGSAITSTASAILAAIQASVPASALVTVAVTGTGSTVQAAAAQTPLASAIGGTSTVTVNLNALSI